MLLQNDFEPFHPRFPWYGPDLQTLRNTFFRTPPDVMGGERLALALDDGTGDALAARLDRPGPARARGKPLAVVVHGLGGDERSTYMIRTARHLLTQGYPVLRLNLRGAGPSRALSGGHYHAGRSDDLAAALRAVPADLKAGGIVLIGYSLGGNLVLKFMGEGAHGHDVRVAASVSAPIDLAATSRRIHEPRNKLYHLKILRTMKDETLAPGAALTPAERAVVEQARTVYEFDDRFVAPRNGYAGAEDYYVRNAAIGFLAQIDRPTLVVHALNDPWIPTESYRTVDWGAYAHVSALLTSGGGHVGFHGRGSVTPWHDRAISRFFARMV
ncbi:MAG TPA: alpha/beta fold hydrolase [Aliidongia sp.]|nr:alpha/beta fold hydrolase [Aliidongia sp.]